MNIRKIMAQTVFIALVFAGAQCWGAAADQVTLEQLRIKKQVEAAMEVLDFVRASIGQNQTNLLNAVLPCYEETRRTMPEDLRRRNHERFVRLEQNQKDELDRIIDKYELSPWEIEEIKEKIIELMPSYYLNFRNDLTRDQVFNS